MANKKVKKIKVVDFIKKLEKIGYDKNTILEFNTVDGNSGEVYDITIEKFINGDDYSVPNENVVDVQLNISNDFIKDVSTEYVEDIAEELNDVLSKYRVKRYY